MIRADNAAELSAGQGDASSPSHKSTPLDFQRRGLYFLRTAFQHDRPQGLLEASVTCFRRAGATDLEAQALAELEAVKAVDLLKASSSADSRGNARGGRAGGGGPSHGVRRALIEAAVRCLECRSGTVKLAGIGASLLSYARQFEQAGRVLAALGQASGVAELRERAAHAFGRARLPLQQGRELEGAGIPAQAVQVYRRHRLYREAVAALDAVGDRVPPDLLRLHAKALMRTASGATAAGSARFRNLR